LLPPEVANDPARVARFQREAEVLASLNYPNSSHERRWIESNHDVLVRAHRPLQQWTVRTQTGQDVLAL
jgi:hypothetical protein